MIDDLLNILDDVATMFSEDATFVKRDGRKIENVALTAENVSSEQFAGKYPMGVNDIFFSLNERALLIEDNIVWPEAGDTIETERGRYKIVKDPQTGRAWEWRWSQPGTRILVRAQEMKGNDK